MKKSVLEALFEAFSEGGILTEDSTYTAMNETVTKVIEQVGAGEADADDLALLQYTSMRAGFYAGVHAMQSLLQDR